MSTSFFKKVEKSFFENINCFIVCFVWSICTNYKGTALIPVILYRYIFKNASAFLLRDARHAMHDILLLRISAILPEAISDGGLTPTTDTDLLLATSRGGSHLTSDIREFS